MRGRGGGHKSSSLLLKPFKCHTSVRRSRALKWLTSDVTRVLKVLASHRFVLTLIGKREQTNPKQQNRFLARMAVCTFSPCLRGFASVTRVFCLAFRAFVWDVGDSLVARNIPEKC